MGWKSRSGGVKGWWGQGWWDLGMVGSRGGRGQGWWGSGGSGVIGWWGSRDEWGQGVVGV